MLLDNSTSASLYLNILKETDQNLKILALEKLSILVDSHWIEISDHL